MEAELDEGLGQVPDASWAVPQMWPKNNDHHHHHHPHHVPDVCYTHVPDVNLYRSY